MHQHDSKAFAEIFQNVCELYGKAISDRVLNIWWKALQPYDLSAIKEAFGRHSRNTDGGRFFPRPADVVRMLEGSTEDAALQAWAQVDQVVRRVGVHESVVFGDPLIHRVLQEMGGWIALGSKQETDWPFVQKEFVARYRGYRERSETPAYPPVLIGTTEAQNTSEGFQSAPPVLVEDIPAAQKVLNGGTLQALGVTRLTHAEFNRLYPFASQAAQKAEHENKPSIALKIRDASQDDQR